VDTTRQEMIKMRAQRRRTRFQHQQPKPYHQLTLSQLGIPSKLVNALEDVGVFTVEEVLLMSLEDVAVVPNLGESYVKALVDSLKRVGATPPWTSRAICRAMLKTDHPASKRKRRKSKKRKKTKPKPKSPK
jgi:hypothetical protein